VTVAIDQDEYKQKMLNMLEDSNTRWLIGIQQGSSLNNKDLINEMKEFGFHQFNHVQKTILQ